MTTATTSLPAMRPMTALPREAMWFFVGAPGPTIGAKDRFLGETQVVPQLIGVVDKELGRERRLRISLNGGIRLRNTTTFTNSDPGLDMAPVTGRSITVGSELPFGVGVAYAVARQRFDIIPGQWQQKIVGIFRDSGGQA